MTSFYPDYERCRTKILIVGEICQCLMNEYSLCPQKKSDLGMPLCKHPDSFKFAGSASGDQPVPPILITLIKTLSIRLVT